MIQALSLRFSHTEQHSDEHQKEHDQVDNLKMKNVNEHYYFRLHI